jgi:hypothetical protein
VGAATLPVAGRLAGSSWPDAPLSIATLFSGIMHLPGYGIVNLRYSSGELNILDNAIM